ncbi:ATP-binding domain-containing protein [Kineothrix sp. MB12-C1]|uniref:ATP-binding domain-containing protein n=1 Tax=Kineothrix sp. MB12-C1 TaxID=3070215 RepID=UPI0027D2D902|nr:ATP-binding domain-containing protein [Kineothrix sp. MB12-C1]WMC92311.1 ATP-binding domain-containing protein [Kineothrix sp. MB12-C1]
MELDITNSKESMTSNIMNHFQTEMQKYNDIMEVQVCVPMRLRGELSCYNINSKIQEIYNPKFNDGNEIEILLEKKSEDSKRYMIRIGDKVLNTKNNYKCTNTEGDTTPVFNGNIGIVKEIESDGYCTIDFVGIGEVVFSKTDSKNLELAYACTVHKMQGSGFTSTIVGMDTGSFIMNNSELLYTAITRAKKYCVLVGNNYAISKAIQTKEVKTKQTFLREMLLENRHRLKVA